MTDEAQPLCFNWLDFVNAPRPYSLAVYQLPPRTVDHRIDAILLDILAVSKLLHEDHMVNGGGLLEFENEFWSLAARFGPSLGIPLWPTAIQV